MEKVNNETYNQLHSQQRNQWHLSICSLIDHQLFTQLINQMWNQLNNQLGDQVYNQLCNKIKGSFYEEK